MIIINSQKVCDKIQYSLYNKNSLQNRNRQFLKLDKKQKQKYPTANIILHGMKVDVLLRSGQGTHCLLLF